MFEGFGAVIPAFNEAEHITGVLESLGAVIPRSNILVVDDGSAVRTAERVVASSVEVIRNPVNMGKGSSLIIGYDRMLKRSDIEAIFTLDADGQHDPEEICRFIDMYRNTRADIVIGSRMSDTAGMPVIRRITNRLTSMIISGRSGHRIDDSQSGYRLIRSSLLRRMTLVTRRFDTESEILIRAARMGAVIASVPIKTIYGTERSKINPFKDTVRFLRLVIRSYFW